MKSVASKFVIGAIFAALVLVAVPAPAAAHDPSCLVSAHAGPVKLHVDCDPRSRADDSHCLVSFNAMFIHEDFVCD